MPSIGWSKNKYHACKLETPDGTFDSKKEYAFYLALKNRQKNGEISNLQRQVKYVLIPAQYGPGEIVQRGANKGKLKKGKLLERECSYYADFVYVENGEVVVVDIKGMSKRLADYVIKRKLMLYVHKIKIVEV